MEIGVFFLKYDIIEPVKNVFIENEFMSEKYGRTINNITYVFKDIIR